MVCVAFLFNITKKTHKTNTKFYQSNEEIFIQTRDIKKQLNENSLVNYTYMLKGR